MFIMTFIAYFRYYLYKSKSSNAGVIIMPVEITYRCWGCREEKTEETPSEDSTRCEVIIWNLCPNCIKKTQERDEASAITFY